MSAIFIPEQGLFRATERAGGPWSPAAAWMRLDMPMVEGEANTPLLQAVQAADFSSGVGQIVDMRQWTFVNPEISLYFFRAPEDQWILIRSRTRVGAHGAGLTVASLSDRRGPFAEVMQAMTFEKREAQAREERVVE
jgi:Thioesterase-like superfamily